MDVAEDDGAYFERGDRAGFFRRLLILLIDGTVVAVAANAWAAGYALLFPESDQDSVVGAAFLVIGFAYLVVLESYSVTLGFLLARVRIVTLKGKRPSILRMTLRLLLWVMGPIHPVIDFLWLGGDDQGQTLRDKLVGTLVVRRKAEPAAQGPIRLKWYTLLGQWYVFFEVERPSAAPPAS